MAHMVLKAPSERPKSHSGFSGPPAIADPSTAPDLTIPPTITLEEHFFSQAHIDNDPPGSYSEQLKHIPGLGDALADLGQMRLKSMDDNGVNIQVVSHGPTQPTLSAETCRASNLQLHKACCAHPTRFAGFAALPMADPDAASQELAFCVEELGFVGALIDNHTADNVTYEGPGYIGFWYTVQSLGVPIYIHPTFATQTQRAGVFAGFDDSLASQKAAGGDGDTVDNLTKSAVDSIMASGWGWHDDVARHILKLFAAGIFDKYPRLKIIIGHMGEMIPYMLGRIEQLSVRWAERKRSFGEVWRENIWVTTSGVWGLEPLWVMLRTSPIDKILYSVDYPFAKNEWGKAWLEQLIASGMCTREQLELICFRNAEKLLGIKVKKEGEQASSMEGEEQILQAEKDKQVQMQS